MQGTVGRVAGTERKSNLSGMARSDVMQRLEAEAAGAGLPSPEIEDGTLPLDAIVTAEEVFQPRDVGAEPFRSRQHIETLAEGIRNTKSHMLEPLDVWWSGAAWYVVDGHHRLSAYQLFREKRGGEVLVAVQPFVGSLREAIAHAIASNIKDKLAMSERDKSNAAWRLVCSATYTIPQIVELAMRSQRTVSTMRECYKALTKRGEDEIEDFSWDEARRAWHGNERPEFNADWKDRQATEWADRLRKAFGGKLNDFPDVFAMALDLYNPKLGPQMIGVGAWAEETIAAAEVLKAEAEMEPDF